MVRTDPSGLAETDAALESKLPKSSRAASFRIAIPITLLLLYFAAWGCTQPHFMGDTNVYAQSILRHRHGVHTGYHQTTSNPFWDFGHLLWRPLASLCFAIAEPVVRLTACQSERARVLCTLIGITFVAAPVCIFLFFLLAKKVMGDTWVAMLVAICLFSADAFLNYAHTGNAYILALTCLIAGMYLSVTESEGTSRIKVILAGLSFALAVLFWFPYVFVVPTALAAPMVLNGSNPQRGRQAAQMLAVCVAVGLAAYVSAIVILRIRTAADLSAWILASGHGQTQPTGFRPLLRLALSFPRSIINVGQDGMWWKRYVVHDPYASVTVAELFRLSLWKLLLFYAGAGIVCYRLWHSERGQKLLILLAAAVLPMVGFGVFIFQAGSIDLFLPLFPFLFLGWGYALINSDAKAFQRALLLIVMLATLVVNVSAMNWRVIEAQKKGALARIHDLVPLLGANSVVIAINEQDSLAQFCENFPFDPINLDAKWTNYDVLEINAARLTRWREDFAKRALATWQQAGTVWLPTRVFQASPRPEWNWVEGDDKRVRWADLPGFFSQFETGSVVGGIDGFAPLLENPKNKELLLTMTSGTAMATAR